MRARIPILDNPPAAKLSTFSSHLPPQIQGDMLAILQNKQRQLQPRVTFLFTFAYADFFSQTPAIIQISLPTCFRKKLIKCFLRPSGRILKPKFLLIYDCTEVAMTLRSVQKCRFNCEAWTFNSLTI